MSAPAASSDGLINFERVSLLALEPSEFGLDLLCQMLRRFGIRQIHAPTSIDAATKMAESGQIDLIVADPSFDRGKGFDFLWWLRREEANANRFTPMIVMFGHSTPKSVRLARDSGANFIVAKPYPPKVLLDRILWVARDQRNYVEAGAYVGPDRRIKNDGPPKGVSGRRDEDPAGFVGADKRISNVGPPNGFPERRVEEPREAPDKNR